MELDPLQWVRDSINSIYGLIDGVKSRIQSVYSDITASIQNMYQYLLDSFDAAYTAISEMGDNLQAYITETVDSVINAITGIYDTLAAQVSDVISAITGLPETIRGIVTSLIDGLNRALSDLILGAQTAVLGAIEPLSEDVSGMLKVLTGPAEFGKLLMGAIEAAW
ncbi:MAG: hypothetical protein PHQ41_04025 [Candidatus Cloacimonetes bacterium]|nr:hypothetical protein [Candidatus Cloacimonadota bacterium]